VSHRDEPSWTSLEIAGGPSGPVPRHICLNAYLGKDQHTQMFIHSGDTNQIEVWLGRAVVNGMTTNPEGCQFIRAYRAQLDVIIFRPLAGFARWLNWSCVRSK